jgi:NAD(P)H-hydrate epimerase
MKFITAKTAKEIDQRLFQLFPQIQLIELAGLAVAQSLTHQIGANKTILVIAGKGNNGRDALVAARHLFQFGHVVKVLKFDPKEKDNEYNMLELQLDEREIKQFSGSILETDFILDGLFGFGFHGEIQQQYKPVFDLLYENSKKVFSIDVPSGWGCEIRGDWEPFGVCSLTLPKECMKGFKGVHYLGGRFISPAMAKEFDLEIPEYKGYDQFVLL